METVQGKERYITKFDQGVADAPPTFADSCLGLVRRASSLGDGRGSKPGERRLGSAICSNIRWKPRRASRQRQSQRRFATMLGRRLAGGGACTHADRISAARACAWQGKRRCMGGRSGAAISSATGRRRHLPRADRARKANRNDGSAACGKACRPGQGWTTVQADPARKPQYRQSGRRSDEHGVGPGLRRLTEMSGVSAVSEPGSPPILPPSA